MAAKTTATRPAARKTPRRAAGTPAATPVAEQEGFRRKPKLFTLEFTGEWEGMIVSVKPMRYGDAADGNVTLDWAQPGVSRDEFHGGLARTSAAFAGVLHAWNLLDEHGEPVPATLEGLRSLDDDQGFRIVMAWAFRAIGVSAPLAGPSSSGETSPEASIPMETLSPNQES